jgi:hypothetical protein
MMPSRGVTTLKPLNGKRQAPVTAHAEKLRLLRAVAQAGMRKRQVRRIQECRGNTEQLKGTDARHRGLTFDMSGGAKGAQRPLRRPLDGGVRCHHRSPRSEASPVLRGPFRVRLVPALAAYRQSRRGQAGFGYATS